MKRKNIYPVAWLLLAALFGCTTPPHWRYENWAPAKVVDVLRLTRTTFFTEDSIGDVSDIAIVDVAGADNRIRVTGSARHAGDPAKSVLLNRQGVVIQTTDFARSCSLGNMAYVPDTIPGPARFINRGKGWQPVSVFGVTGVQLWEQGGAGPAPNSLAIGDIEGNGLAEFVVGYNASGGIAVLDLTGLVLRRGRGGNIWHVEIADTNSDGIQEIIHSNSKGHLVIRSHDLSVLTTIRTRYFISDFTFCRWPANGASTRVLFRDRNAFVIMTLQGQIELTIPDPEGYPFSSNIKCIWVRFRGDSDPYLAIVEGIRATWHRSRLSIFSVTGKVVYQEVLADYIPAIAALPKENNELEQTLLVGGDGVVWEYGRFQPSPGAYSSEAADGLTGNAQE